VRWLETIISQGLTALPRLLMIRSRKTRASFLNRRLVERQQPPIAHYTRPLIITVSTSDALVA
jgi:hypothetical protein